jgi:cytochrome c551
VVVSATIFGLAKLVPFEPAADVAASTGGDPTRGEALFATNCAGCHGNTGAGGGIGPKLAGVPREAGDIASTVATGRGAMPAGVVSGTDAADVVAYVVSIGAGTTPATNGTTAETAPSGDTRGTVTLLGNRLQGLAVELDEPAPEGWAVWVGGPRGARRVVALGANARTVRLGDAGIGSLAVGSDAVLVGPSSDAPALRADIAGVGELLVTSPTAANGASLIDGMDGQIDLLRTHIRFLRKARDERNLANIRFHGEHLVNIARGEPVADIDGNGDASNPGDGVGLLGQPDRGGYLPRILALAGPDLADGVRLREAIGAIARDARRCGEASNLTQGRRCVQAIVARDRDLARYRLAVRDELRAKATSPLRSP